MFVLRLSGSFYDKDILIYFPVKHTTNEDQQVLPRDLKNVTEGVFVLQSWLPPHDCCRKKVPCVFLPPNI